MIFIPSAIKKNRKLASTFYITMIVVLFSMLLLSNVTAQNMTQGVLMDLSKLNAHKKQTGYCDTVILGNASNASNKKITFDSAFECYGAHFKNDPDITDDVFKGWADFSASVFDSDAHFEHDTIFNFGLKGTGFKREVYFDNTKFMNSVHFEDLKWGDSSVFFFEDAILPDNLFFRVKQKNSSLEIDLTVANYKARLDSLTGKYKKHNIFFSKSDLSMFNLDYRYFQLIFEDSMHGYYLTEDEKSSVYEGLLQNFSHRGQLESYKLLDLEYQNFKWGKPYIHWLRWLPMIWWNYGYNKEYIFLWIAGLLFFFSSVNFFMIDYLNSKVYKVFDLDQPNVFKKNSLRLYWLSFFYTATIFLPLTMKIEKVNFKQILGAVYVLIVYSLGLLCLAYLANFIIQK